MTPSGDASSVRRALLDGIGRVEVMGHSENGHMRELKRFAAIITALIGILTPTVSFAWNYTGHRVIASIAYR